MLNLRNRRLKLKNSPKLQVRNLNCQSPHVRNFFCWFAIADLQTCRLTCGLAQFCSLTPKPKGIGHQIWFAGGCSPNECYVIALNPDLLYCIFEFLICLPSREERGLQGIFAVVVI